MDLSWRFLSLNGDFFIKVGMTLKRKKISTDFGHSF